MMVDIFVIIAFIVMILVITWLCGRCSHYREVIDRMFLENEDLREKLKEKGDSIANEQSSET